MLHALYSKCNADLYRVFAAGKVPVIVALSHADPEAVRVKGRAGYQHQVQLFRGEKLCPL